MNDDTTTPTATDPTATDEPPTIECEECWGEGYIAGQCAECGAECESCTENCITCDGTGEIPNPDYPTDADPSPTNTDTNTQETIK